MPRAGVDCALIDGHGGNCITPEAQARHVEGMRRYQRSERGLALRLKWMADHPGRRAAHAIAYESKRRGKR